MKKIYGYIAAGVITGSLIISSGALAQISDIAAEPEQFQDRAETISTLSRDHLEKSLERIRKIERTVTIKSRPFVLERSAAGRIHWYALEKRVSRVNNGVVISL